MLDIVIVNWNSGRQLCEAVQSIAEHSDDVECKVIIVDNASHDSSLDILAQVIPAFPFEVDIVRNATNRGFGAACNQGAARGTNPFVLFLNPDTRIFKESLKAPLNYMSGPQNSDVGICGVQLIDHDNSVARSCSRFPSVSAFIFEAIGLNKFPPLRCVGSNMAEWAHDSTREVDQLIGAFFLIRRGLFNALGGFDERFFVYFEEVDLSFRAKRAGWRSIYLAESRAFHAGGGTSGQVKAARLFYSLRSRLLYGFKHFSKLHTWVLLSVTLLVEPVTRSFFFLAKGRVGDVKETIRGYRMLAGALRKIVAAGKK